MFAGYNIVGVRNGCFYTAGMNAWYALQIVAREQGWTPSRNIPMWRESGDLFGFSTGVVGEVDARSLADALERGLHAGPDEHGWTLVQREDSFSPELLEEVIAGLRASGGFTVEPAG